MSDSSVRITYIGGPTAGLEVGGLRFLTDPTFDPAGAQSTTGSVLHKTQSPALLPPALGSIDAVLLSHDHHFDNLDAAGRAMLPTAGRVLTTRAGQQRLGPPSLGLEAWEETEVVGAGGRRLRVVATPARHGPAHADRGPVIGFVLGTEGQAEGQVYVSGDTVWFEGVADVARRYRVRVALLFMGAARTAAAGPWNLTFTAAEAVEAARALGDATIVPLHYEGWEHFTEGREEIDRTFADAGLAKRLLWLPPGQPVDL